VSGTPRVAADAAVTPRRARHSRPVTASRADSGFGIGLGDKGFVVAAVLTALWAVFQNFYKLGTAPILADEPTYTRTAWRYVHGQVLAPVPLTGGRPALTPDNFEHPPLTKYLFGLAQLIGGSPSGLTAARVISALATVLAGVAVAVWIGRAAGRWTGLLAGALLTVLPEPAGGSIGRFDRFAMLDPVASLFMVLSVVAAWEWSKRTGRGAWLSAALTGAAVGCAAGSKENGFLGAVGPVIATLVIAPFVPSAVSSSSTAVPPIDPERSGRRSPAHALLLRSAQALVAIVVSLAFFVGLYVPLGHPIDRIRYLIDFQSAQSSVGHMVGFAGRVTADPPWWTNFWFAGHNYGSVLTVFLVTAALCAVVLRRDLLVWWCLAALSAPFVFHCFIANVTLGYYWVMWTPMFLVLAALGAAEVIRRAATAPRLTIPIALVAGAVVLAVPVGESIDQSLIVADMQPTGVMVVPTLMREHNLTGPIVSAGVPVWSLSYYLPGTTIYTSAAKPITGAETIVISKPQCRDLIDRSVRALVAVNLKTGHVQQMYTDSQITAYAVTGPLAMPTAAQINAERPGKLTDHC
jgi:4-amino-4-deoxy-L-arabinose transferase-like glycosyltransferase